MGRAGKEVAAISGGTGSAKLIRGMAGELAEFTVVVNVADNVWMHGLYVCPDVDIILYTLAGIADGQKGWGITGDTFTSLGQLHRLGEETWFQLGDRDIAVQLFRTELLRRGRGLTAVTAMLAERLGVRQRVLPASDGSVETRIVTKEGLDLHLQEFWVRDRAAHEVARVRYRGAGAARITRQVADAVSNARRIIFCPANPVTSILPTLSIRGARSALKTSRARRVAVSPMVGEGAVSGPATKLMVPATGYAATSLGVASLYRGMIDAIVIDEKDKEQAAEIEAMDISCVCAPTIMRTPDDERSLARIALEA